MSGLWKTVVVIVERLFVCEGRGVYTSALFVCWGGGEGRVLVCRARDVEIRGCNVYCL